MSQSTTALKRLSDITGKYGFFVDGDWVESKDQDPSGEVRLTQLADIGVGEFLDRSSRFLTKHTATRLNCSFLEKGDILVARMPDPIGRACIFPGDKYPCVTVVDVCIIRPDPDIADNKWLMWMINSPEFRHRIEPFLSGTTRKRISRKNLEKLSLEIPSLKEQKRIAAILDKADAIRRKRKEAIALTEELLRSTFLDMFGDPVTNPKGWSSTTLGKLISFMTSGSRGWAKYYSETGRLFLRIQNVKDGTLLLNDIAFVEPPDCAETRRTLVKQGDVIISITADLGRTAVIPSGLPPTHINQHLALVRVDQDKIDPSYLAAFLSSVGGQIQFERLNREGVKAGLNFDDIKSLNILVPPIHEQKEYLKLKDKYLKLSQEYAEVVNKSDNLFNSLLQKSFRGEL